MPQVNFSCPDDLKNRLEAYAKLKYTSEATIIRQCLDLFLPDNSQDKREITENVLPELLSDGDTQPPVSGCE